MVVSKNMNTLVLKPNYFHCFEGNVGNMAVTRKRHHRQRANMCHFVFYIMLFQKVIVYKIPPTPWGRGSVAGPRSVVCALSENTIY